MKINLFGHPYEIILMKGYRKESGNWGKHNAEMLCVVVDSDSAETIQKETLLHELGEAINFWFDLGMTHHQVDVFTKGLWAALGSNPVMMEWLLKSLDDTT